MQPDNDILYNEYGLNILGLFGYILEGIFGIFGGDGSKKGASVGDIWHFLSVVWDIFSIVSLLVSAALIYGIVYSYLRINEYLALESKKLDLAEEIWREMHGSKNENQRWAEVQRHVASDRPNDWKLAIIEADIMLGDALKEKGYAGMSIGDQLKSISTMQLASLQDAWDAHRIRNRIAHEGTDFVLTQNSAREAIVKYERTFRELSVI